MQKLVIDTNIFISNLLSRKGFSFKIVNDILINKNALFFISDEVLSEYKKVFNRERFIKKIPDFFKTSGLLYKQIISSVIHLYPSKAFSLIKDETANRFLEVAYASNADYLITGNKLHFTFSNFYNTQIVSPKNIGKIINPEN